MAQSYGNNTGMHYQGGFGGYGGTWVPNTYSNGTAGGTSGAGGFWDTSNPLPTAPAKTPSTTTPTTGGTTQYQGTGQPQPNTTYSAGGATSPGFQSTEGSGLIQPQGGLTYTPTTQYGSGSGGSLTQTQQPIDTSGWISDTNVEGGKAPSAKGLDEQQWLNEINPYLNTLPSPMWGPWGFEDQGQKNMDDAYKAAGGSGSVFGVAPTPSPTTTSPTSPTSPVVTQPTTSATTNQSSILGTPTTDSTSYAQNIWQQYMQQMSGPAGGTGDFLSSTNPV